MSSRLLHYCKFFTLLLLLNLPVTGYSAETSAFPFSTNNNSSDPIITLPVVVVEGTRIAPITGATILDREMIENLPSGNGSINELIGTIPGVQYGEGSRSSASAGEIIPPDVSISGSRYYENNFTIDGISNNSALDPASKDIHGTSTLPGHPQKIFLDPRLIEQATIYDSNIPAKYGGFTGGQVAITTLDPLDGFRGNLNYRTTNGRWTNFHIDPTDQDNFNNSNTVAKQPNFTKQSAGFILNTPLGNNMGLLSSYHRLNSSIKLTHLGEKKNRQRTNENFFFKYGYGLPDGTQLYLTGLYSPYEENYFFTNGKDSDYKTRWNNKALIANIKKDLLSGKLDFKAAYSDHAISRTAPRDKFQWLTATNSIDWGGPKFSLAGGTGNFRQEQKEIQFNTNFSFKEKRMGSTRHQFALGLEIIHSHQSYKRSQTSYSYWKSLLIDPANPLICGTHSVCITGEQYFSHRFVYNKGHSEVDVTSSAGYLQDDLVWGRLELFPGLRLSYDDYTRTPHIAPRFSTAYDVFGHKRTILFGGINRYYSGSLLTYKLREAISPLGKDEAYDPATDTWSLASRGYTVYRASKLKTPFTNEITLGLIQKLLGGEIKAQYIKRKSKDELARERTDLQDDGYKHYIFNNNGRSTHQSYQLSWQYYGKIDGFEINGTYQKSTTSNESYNSTVDDNDINDLIYYNGKEIGYDKIPKKDFSRPIVANLIYTRKINRILIFTNTTKFRSPYWKLKNTGIIHRVQNSGAKVYEYKKLRMQNSLNFDWRLALLFNMGNMKNARLIFDIYNVFDSQSTVSYQKDEFELGRQLWAGIEFNF